MIINKFAVKVGKPWILQTNLTKWLVLQKYNVTEWVLYREKKTDTEKKKEKKKKNPHIYIIYTSVYMQHNAKKIVRIIITIIIFVANKN